MKKHIYDIKGSVATISILTITAVVVAVALAMANLNASIANSQMNVVSSKITYYGAEACLEEALIRVRRDPFFSGDTVEIDESHICKIEVWGDVIEINTNYLYYDRNFVAEFLLTEHENVNRIQLINWKEI